MEFGTDLDADTIQEYLNSDDPMKRVIGARKASSHQHQFLSKLITLLADEFYEVRAYAAKSLGRIGNTDAIDKILPLLTDEVEEVRFSAAEALSYFTDSGVIKPLLQTLSDYSRETRRQATVAISKQPSADIYDEMMSWLRSLAPEDYQMQNEHSIHKIDVSRGIMEAAGHLDEPWINEILKFGLSNPDLEMTRLACISIGQQQLSSFSPQLLELRSHEDDDLRLAVVYALTQIDIDHKLSILLDHVDDNNEFIRELLGTWLPQLFNPNQVLTHVQQLSQDRLAMVRAAVASQIQSEEYLPVLEQLILDEVGIVRKHAVTTLGTIGSIRARNLLSGLEDEDELVQIAIENSRAGLE